MDGIGYWEIEPKCERVSEPSTEDSNFKMDGIGYREIEPSIEDSNFKMDGIGYREIESKCERVPESSIEDLNA